MPVEKQIAIIFCGTNGLLSDVPIGKVHDFESQYLNVLEVKHKDVLEQLRKGVVNDDIKAVLKNVATDINTSLQNN